MISVHRFEDLMVPRFFWFDFLLHASLYSMYGVPVSIWELSIWYHSSWARIDLRALPWASYPSYRASNSSPYTSARPRASLGQNRLQFASACTRFMKRSGTHMP